jgi:hypothetical protein
MHLTRRHFVGAVIAATAGASSPRLMAQTKSIPPRPATALARARQGERPPLLDEALAALDRHSESVLYRDRIGLVDFADPSRDKRFHLVDVGSGRIERSWLVAHGSGSDPGATGMLQWFSNVPGSNASACGAYLAGQEYVGQHGRSRRLVGLDPTNDNAMSRAIVIHGASYVDPSLIHRQGRIGRSQGCLAVEPDEIAAVLERFGEGRMIYAGKSA